MIRRPLLPIALFFSMGICLAQLVFSQRTMPSLYLLPTVISLLISLLPSPSIIELTPLGKLGGSMIPRLRSLSVYLLAVWFGFSLFCLTKNNHRHLPPAKKEADARLRGQIVSYPKLNRGEGSGKFELRTPNRKGDLKVFLQTNRGFPRLEYGDKIELTGDLCPPKEFSGFDYPAFLRRRGIVGLVFNAEIEDRKSGRGRLPLEFGWWIRKKLMARISHRLPERGPLFQSLLLGDEDLMDSEVQRDFRRTGLAHLLAASGLHLGLILAVSWSFLSALKLKIHLIYLLNLPLPLLYLLVTGFKTPLLRASIIFVFAGFAFVFSPRGLILKKWRDPFQALSLAWIVLLLIEPGELFELGFQLSFAATFAIVTLTGGIERRLPSPFDSTSLKRAVSLLRPGWDCLKRWSSKLSFDWAWLKRFPRFSLLSYLKSILAASIAAQLGVAPVILFHLQCFHPWTPFFNLLAIPATAVCIYCGLLCILLPKPLFFPLAKMEANLLQVYLKGVEKVARTPLIKIGVPRPNILWLGVYLFALLWFWWRLEGGLGVRDKGRRLYPHQ